MYSTLSLACVEGFGALEMPLLLYISFSPLNCSMLRCCLKKGTTPKIMLCFIIINNVFVYLFYFLTLLCIDPISNFLKVFFKYIFNLFWFGLGFLSLLMGLSLNQNEISLKIK